MRSASRKRDRLEDLRMHLDWILLILILFITFVAIILVPALLTVDKLVSVPYTLHSILNADYGVDDMAISYAQVKSDIIAEVIRDQNDMTLGDSPEKPGLYPSIAITTPYPDSTGTPTTFPGQPSSTPAPTATNNYPPPTNGGTPTSTQPSATGSPTNTTAVAATDSPTQKATTRPPNPTSPPPTATPRPPTRTPAPTAPRPTNTPRPPDPTDPPDPPDPYPPPPSGNTPYP